MIINERSLESHLEKVGYPGEKKSGLEIDPMKAMFQKKHDRLAQHPVMEVYRSLGMNLISLYYNLTSNPYNSLYELQEIEFLPVVTAKSFFGDKKDLKSKLKSTPIISA